MSNNKQILSLQGWRAIMMIIVIVSHVFGFNIIYGGAGEAMSFFFVLSGFVLSLGFGSKCLSFKFAEIKTFIKKRLNKIYPLYIIMLFFCLLMYIGFALVQGEKGKIVNCLKYFFVDSVLLQAWIPLKEYYMSLNGVSWFLSSLLFSYMMFIPTNIVVNKIKKSSFKLIYVSLSLMFIALFCYELVCKNGGSNQYYTYVFPLYRYFEFVIGMLIAEIFKNKNLSHSKESKVVFSVLEVLIIIYFLVEYLVGDVFSIKFGIDGVMAFAQLAVMSLLIYVYSFEQGIVSRLISSKVFLVLASISFEMYLIHQPFQNAIGALFSKLDLTQFAAVATVISTIIAAIIWTAITKKNKEKKICRGYYGIYHA